MNITILQWNIWYKEKVEHIVEFLKTQDADIICRSRLHLRYKCRIFARGCGERWRLYRTMLQYSL